MHILTRSLYSPHAYILVLFLAIFASVSLPVQAAELSAGDSSPESDTPTTDQHMNEHSRSNVPAGVYGAKIMSAGKFGFSYTPMLMHMADNYMGASIVSPQTIATTIPSQTTMSNGMLEKYRIVPTAMDTQSHMFNFMYGVTDSFNLMVMASYQIKSMSMTTFSGATGTTILGTGTSSTEGAGDTTVSSLWRIYHDSSNDVNFNFGLSLPTGSTTQTMSMLTPMASTMTMRASYGMQLGSGTYDLLPGITFTNHGDNWSWGAAWRNRFALGNNSEGYHYGTLNEASGWGGYTPSPGITWSARITESIQESIQGADPMISGLMEGSNPNFYGGKHTDVLAGIEIAGGPFGFKNKHLALEAGKTVAQDLNGPQLGRDWIVNASIGAGF